MTITGVRPLKLHLPVTPGLLELSQPGNRYDGWPISSGTQSAL